MASSRNWVGIQAEETQEKHEDFRVCLNRTSAVLRFQSGPGWAENRFQTCGQMQHPAVESSTGGARRWGSGFGGGLALKLSGGAWQSRQVEAGPQGSFDGKKFDGGKKFGSPGQAHNLQLLSKEALGSCPNRLGQVSHRREEQSSRRQHPDALHRKKTRKSPVFFHNLKTKKPKRFQMKTFSVKVFRSKQTQHDPGICLLAPVCNTVNLPYEDAFVVHTMS
eukprot:bmy_11001T0